MHRCPLGDLMYEAKYITVFKFSRGEVTLEVARRVNAREPMTSGQLQSIHLKKSTVVWIAGNIDLGNNSSSVPSTPPFLSVSQLRPVNDRKSSAWGQHYKHTLLRRLKRQLNRAEKDKLVFIFSSIFSLIFCYSLSTLSSPEYFWSNRSLRSPTPHASESTTQNPALAEGRLTFRPLIFMIYLKAGPILFLFERSNLPLALGKKTTKGEGTEISFKSF